jgi:hypothetical protein
MSIIWLLEKLRTRMHTYICTVKKVQLIEVSDRIYEGNFYRHSIFREQLSMYSTYFETVPRKKKYVRVKRVTDWPMFMVATVLSRITYLLVLIVWSRKSSKIGGFRRLVTPFEKRSSSSTPCYKKNVLPRAFLYCLMKFFINRIPSTVSNFFFAFVRPRPSGNGMWGWNWRKTFPGNRVLSSWETVEKLPNRKNRQSTGPFVF